MWLLPLHMLRSMVQLAGRCRQAQQRGKRHTLSRRMGYIMPPAFLTAMRLPDSSCPEKALMSSAANAKVLSYYLSLPHAL